LLHIHQYRDLHFITDPQYLVFRHYLNTWKRDIWKYLNTCLAVFITTLTLQWLRVRKGIQHHLSSSPGLMVKMMYLHRANPPLKATVTRESLVASGRASVLQ